MVEIAGGIILAVLALRYWETVKYVLVLAGCAFAVAVLLAIKHG